MNQEQLKSLLDYDPETGVFTHRERPGRPRWNQTFAGKPAGGPTGSGDYCRIGLNGKRYLAHRLAWLYVYGELPEEVGHTNGDRSDNRIANLFASSRSDTLCRRAPWGKSGVRGIYFTPTGRCVVQVTRGGAHYRVGMFETLHDAVAAWEDAIASL